MIVDEEELIFGCGEGGRLIGYTFCFNSAHAECCGLGDQRTNAPRGDWSCPACIDHARDQLKSDSDDGESDDDGDESGDDGESDGDGESGGGEDESEEEKSDDSEDDDDDGCGDSDENEEESEYSEEDDDISVLVKWIQNSNTTIRMLKEKCRGVGLKTNDRKHEVVQRLLDHFNYDHRS